MENFFGSWTLDRNENFDEYLTKKGLNWMLRQIIKRATTTKIFSQNEDGSYRLVNSMPMKQHVWNFKLGEEVPDAVGFEYGGVPHKLKFALNAETLEELHCNPANNNWDTFTYSLDDGSLVLKMAIEDVTAKQYFKKS